MSAREEEEHGFEAIVKVLTKALTDIKGSLTDSLKPLTFDWNSPEQYKDFWLFIKGMESWYTLRGIPDKDGDTTQLEYLLNFLGPIRWLEHEQKSVKQSLINKLINTNNDFIIINNFNYDMIR